MEAGNTPRGLSEVETNASTGWTPANAISPHTESGAVTSPLDAGSSEPPAKKRREEKERTRVSRACDRCKK
jgi:hypothetical protein